MTPRPTLNADPSRASRLELKQRLDELYAQGKLLEAQRLEQRTTFDLEMMEATGSCAGIENYSRYLSGRKPGEPPPTLFEYLPDNALVFIDESHVTVPQIGGMYRGDFRRKATLVGVWVSPALLHGQPSAEIRGMGGDAPQTVHRLRHSRLVGDGSHRRRLRRAGHPPDRPHRSRPSRSAPPAPRSTTCSMK